MTQPSRRPFSTPRFVLCPWLARVGLGLALWLVAGLTGTASAAPRIPPVLQPPAETERKVQFNFGLGPSARIGTAGWYGNYYADYYAGNCDRGRCRGGWAGGYHGAFKLHQEIMVHLTGRWHGPALGLMTQQEFAGGYFGLNIAPRFTYDIRIIKNLAFLISPHVSLGYHLSHWNYYFWNTYYGRGGPNYHAANLQFGVAAKLMLAQRWLVWVQTPSFDFNIGPGSYYCPAGLPGCGTYFAARYDFLVGGGVAF